MWLKLGDEYIDDAADLSDAEFRTHVEALAWHNRRLPDKHMHVAKRDLRRFAFSPNAEQATDKLMAIGWWEDCADEECPNFAAGCWYLAYRPEWQPKKEQVENRRKQNQEAQERKRRHDAGDHEICLPDKCPVARKAAAAARKVAKAAASAADGAADQDADTNADPGRDGSGLGQSGLLQKNNVRRGETETQHDDGSTPWPEDLEAAAS